MSDVLAEVLEGIAGRLSVADTPEGIENAVNELLALANGQRALVTGPVRSTADDARDDLEYYFGLEPDDEQWIKRSPVRRWERVP